MVLLLSYYRIIYFFKIGFLFVSAYCRSWEGNKMVSTKLFRHKRNIISVPSYEKTVECFTQNIILSADVYH